MCTVYTHPKMVFLNTTRSLENDCLCQCCAAEPCSALDMLAFNSKLLHTASHTILITAMPSRCYVLEGMQTRLPFHSRAENHACFAAGGANSQHVIKHINADACHTRTGPSYCMD
jgi:hypothetical protein